MAIIGTLPSWFSDKNQQLYKGSLIQANLVEIRIPKKFSVCIFILISFQALSKVFWKFKIWGKFDHPVHSDGYFGMDG
jgi:hypothetical protein